MRYGFIGVAKPCEMEGRFVMLLANLEGCRIGVCEGVGGGVGRPCMIVIVGRGRREGGVDCFGREAISAHDIGFLGVVGEEVGGEAGGVGGENGACGEGGAGFSWLVGFLVCFVRTWS